MPYFVLGANGERFGPADLATLQRWMTEGRIANGSVIENTDTGQKLYASQVPGLGRPAEVQQPVFQPVYSVQPVRRSFHWGACILPFLWGPAHQVWGTLVILVIEGAGTLFQIQQSKNMVSLLTDWQQSLIISAFVLIVPSIMRIYYGYKGYELAWKSGRFQTPQECDACQRIWSKWGIWINVISCLCCGGWIAMVVIGIMGRMGGPSGMGLPN